MNPEAGDTSSKVYKRAYDMCIYSSVYYGRSLGSCGHKFLSERS